MAYRVLKDIKNTMLNAIISIGAEQGVSKTSAKKIAEYCGISTFTVFEHFQTIRNAWDCAALSIDTPRMKKTLEMIESGATARELWDYMLDDFVKNANETLYYISYTNTFGFDPTANNPRSEEFLRVAKVLFLADTTATDNDFLLKWDYITSMAFYYAEKIIRGYIPFSAESKASIRNVVFCGIGIGLD